MSCRIEDSRGGFFALTLHDTADDESWYLGPHGEPDEQAHHMVCVGDTGSHITVVAGPYPTPEAAMAAAAALNEVAIP